MTVARSFFPVFNGSSMSLLSLLYPLRLAPRDSTKRNNMIKIMVFDPELLAREGIKSIVDSHKDLTIVHDADSPHQLLCGLLQTDVDVIVMEIPSILPAIGLIRQLRKLLARSSILIFTCRPERDFALRFFRAGASGFVHKNNSNEELITAIRRVAAGKPYMSEATRELLALSLSSLDKERPHNHLSDRDFDILCMIADGNSPSRIAEIVHVTPATINSRKCKLMRRLCLRNMADVVKYAVTNQLIEESAGSRWL